MELVLVGGGHAHVEVLRRFGAMPQPGLRVVAVARELLTPYSGMLPGYLAGHYPREACHIDLRPLAERAGAHLIHAEACGLDLGRRQVHCRDGTAVPFDLLSLDIGGRPATAAIPGAAQHALPVKPVDGFLAAWAACEAAALAAIGRYRVVVVGGGAGGVELCLALRHRLRLQLAAAGADPDRASFALVTDTTEILPSHAPWVRRRLTRGLIERGVVLHLGCRVERVEPGRLSTAAGDIGFDAAVWAVGVAAPSWPGAAGLATDPAGFVAVDATLRSLSHPEIFAAGDIAALDGHCLAKAGVYAVRQGPVLAENLRRVAQGAPLRSYQPQRQFLSLISTGDRRAVASRGRLVAEGAWVWRLKDWIDRSWMRRYQRA